MRHDDGMTGEMSRHTPLAQQVEAMRQNDLHALTPPKTDSAETESVFYFLAPSGTFVTDGAVFDSTPGRMAKTLHELGYAVQAHELLGNCYDALERGMSLSDIEAMALDFFYDVDAGAYEKFVDHVYEPRAITQQLELPSGWLQRVA